MTCVVTLWYLLAVLNDHIRPPIKIQTKDKLAWLLTYVIYIDLFPHVLENHCFTGHIHETHGNGVKMRNLESVKAESVQKNAEKAHVPWKFRPSPACTSANTYFVDSFTKCSWFFWCKVLRLVNLYSYLLVGSSSVLVADTLVEGPDKDE